MSSRRRTYGGGDGKLGIYADSCYNSKATYGGTYLDNHLMYSDDGMRNMKFGCMLPIPSDEVINITYGGANFYLNPSDDGYIYCVGKYPTEYISTSLPEYSRTRIVIYKVDLSGCDYTDPSVMAPYEVVYWSDNDNYDYYYKAGARSYIIGDLIYIYTTDGRLHGSYNIKSGVFTEAHVYNKTLASNSLYAPSACNIDDKLILLGKNTNSLSVEMSVISGDTSQDSDVKDIMVRYYDSDDNPIFMCVCNDMIMCLNEDSEGSSITGKSLEIYGDVREHIRTEAKWRGYSKRYSSMSLGGSDTSDIIASGNYKFQDKDSSKVLAMVEKQVYREYPTWIINEGDYSKTSFNTCNSMFTQFRNWTINEFDGFYLINGNDWGYGVTYDEFKTSQVTGIIGHDTYTDTYQLSNHRYMSGIIKL